MTVAIFSVVDTDNQAVKGTLAAGGYTTVQSVSSGFSSLAGIVVNGNGDLLVADQANGAVIRLRPAATRL